MSFLLKEIYLRYGVEIHAYCLMDNHYHLLVQTTQANLGRAMRHLDGIYTQRFNKLMKRDGPLFRGRYKACLIEGDEYLLEVSRHIHLNPVRALMVKNAETYRWSSFAAYLNLRNSDIPLSTHETLNAFQKNLDS